MSLHLGFLVALFTLGFTPAPPYRPSVSERVTLSNLRQRGVSQHQNSAVSVKEMRGEKLLGLVIAVKNSNGETILTCRAKEAELRRSKDRKSVQFLMRDVFMRSPDAEGYSDEKSIVLGPPVNPGRTGD
jgi:hypothetical protein